MNKIARLVSLVKKQQFIINKLAQAISQLPPDLYQKLNEKTPYLKGALYLEINGQNIDASYNIDLTFEKLLNKNPNQDLSNLQEIVKSDLESALAGTKYKLASCFGEAKPLFPPNFV
jgi:hypothetical protein